MKGLKIKSLEIVQRSDEGITGYIHNRLENNVSDFCCFFSDLIEILDEFCWVITEDSTYISWDIDEQDNENDSESDEFMDFHEKYEQYKSYRMYDNFTFKKYIGYVKDDWNKIICIKKGNCTLQEIVKKLTSLNGEEKIKYIEEYIDLVFLNIDGLYWAVFTNDYSKLNIIQKSLKKYESQIIVDVCNITDCVNFI